MTTSQPRVIVVEIDGLHFRIQAYRNRRSSRAMAMLVRLLGASAVHLFSGQAFARLTQAEQIQKLAVLFAAANKTGGTATDPDEFEAGARELLAWTSKNGGEGVCLSPDPLDEDAKGWQVFRGLETLDPYDDIDCWTTTALLWETIKLNFRPILAESGTDAGTGPAELTSGDSTTSSANEPSPRSTSSNGSPPPSTPPQTGITIG